MDFPQAITTYHEQPVVTTYLEPDLVKCLRRFHDNFYEETKNVAWKPTRRHYMKVHLCATPVLLVEAMFLAEGKASNLGEPPVVFNLQVNDVFDILVEMFGDSSSGSKVDFHIAEAAVNLVFHLQEFFDEMPGIREFIKGLCAPLKNLRKYDRLHLAGELGKTVQSALLEANIEASKCARLVAPSNQAGKGHHVRVQVWQYCLLMGRACMCLYSYYASSNGPYHLPYLGTDQDKERCHTAQDKAIAAYFKAEGRDSMAKIWTQQTAAHIGTPPQPASSDPRFATTNNFVTSRLYKPEIVAYHNEWAITSKMSADFVESLKRFHEKFHQKTDKIDLTPKKKDEIYSATQLNHYLSVHLCATPVLFVNALFLAVPGSFPEPWRRVYNEQVNWVFLDLRRIFLDAQKQPGVTRVDFHIAEAAVNFVFHLEDYFKKIMPVYTNFINRTCEPLKDFRQDNKLDLSGEKNGVQKALSSTSEEAKKCHDELVEYNTLSRDHIDRIKRGDVEMYCELMTMACMCLYNHYLSYNAANHPGAPGCHAAQDRAIAAYVKARNLDDMTKIWAQGKPAPIGTTFRPRSVEPKSATTKNVGTSR